MSDTVIEQVAANPKAAQWAVRIAAQQRSGISVKQFCKEQGLTDYSFYARRKRLQETGPLRFRQIAQAVPDLSDRLLAERMRELETRGLVTRTELEVGVEYALTEMGRDLDAAVTELRAWARRWLAQ